MKLYNDKAKLYDEFIDVVGKDYSVEFLMGKIGSGKRVLDLGCGTGRYAEELMKKGYEVFGIDKNEGMVEVAKEKGVDCLKGDMREFKDDKKFDAVVCMYNTLFYNLTEDDLRKTLGCCKENLSSNGVVVFEVTNPEKLKDVGSVLNRWKLDGKEVVQVSSVNYPFMTNYFIFTDFNLRENVVDEHKMRIYSVDLVKKVLNELGFEVDVVEKGVNVFVVGMC